MAGAALLAGIVGKQEKPPRMELTWDVEPAVSFPAPSVEVADTSEGDEEVEKIVESDPLREKLDPSKQLVGEGEGLVLIAVDKASGLPLPGAEVAFVDYAAARARHREEGGPPYANRVELAERYGAVLVTGAEGKVRLPGIARQVALVVELGRVHEDRNPHAVGVAATGLDQGEVPLVECAHRRHQRDAPTGGALGVRQGLQLGGLRYDAHDPYS